jgi:drug/metabolite transporter (DMT)-like permease
VPRFFHMRYHSRVRRIEAAVLLLGVTAVWGWTFTIVREAIAIYGVVPFLALRFLIAALAVGLVWGRRLDRSSLVTGSLIGLVITGLFVVLAPVADRVLYKTRQRPAVWAAVVLSLAGMGLLSGSGPEPLNVGDLMTLGCAIAFGVHIALLSRHAPRHDAQALTVSQMLACAVVFLAAWPVSAPLTPPPRAVWFALALTGLVASALAFFIQTAVQRHLSAAATALILTMEPVFAAAFGYLLGGERLGTVQLAGGVLILVALVVAQRAETTI